MWTKLPVSYTGLICIRVIKTRQVGMGAGHCWRSRDALISDVLLWTPTYGRAKAGRPARAYIRQLCEDTGCSPEDLPEVMNDKEKWRERVRDIRASGTTWWWWWWLRLRSTLQAQLKPTAWPLALQLCLKSASQAKLNVTGLPDIAWLLSSLQLEWNFFNHLATV